MSYSATNNKSYVTSYHQVQKKTFPELTVSFLITVAIFSNNSYAHSPDISQLIKLPMKEQRQVVITEIERYRKLLNNITFSASSETQGFQWNNGSIGVATNEGVRSQITLWRIGGSYKLNAELSSNVTTPETILRSLSGFDQLTGLSRSFADHKGTARTYGRIDTVRDNTEGTSSAVFYLAEGLDVNGQSFWADIIDQFDNWMISAIPTRKRIVISYPHINPEARVGEFAGSRTISLVWEPNFYVAGNMLVWRMKNGDKETWWNSQTTLEEPVEVDDVLIPTKITSINRNSGLGEVVCAKETTTVQNISIGNVGIDDLLVRFPKGVYVTNAIEQVSYLTNVDGEPADEPVPFYREGESGEAQSSTKTSLFLWLNVVLIAVIAAIVAWRRIHS